MNLTESRRDYPHFYALYKHEKPGISLALVCTDLSTKNEELLRTFLMKRASNGLASRMNDGSFCTLDFRLESTKDEMKTEHRQQSVVCYYSTLNQPMEGSSQEDDEEDDILKDPEFTICLLTSSEVNLEFFRPELQEFCQNMAPLLGLKVNNEKLDFKTYLKSWYYEAIQYLSRCVAVLGDDVALVFHLASMNRRLDISGENAALKSDISRFLNACCLSELISGISRKDQQYRQVNVDDNNERTGSDDNGHPKLVLNAAGSYSFSDRECDDYCVDWARLIMGGDRTDPMFIKSVIEHFKLTTVQSMNTFKRLVTDAEVNHYALYRAFTFLKNSKQKAVLLENAKMYDDIVSSSSALDVMKVLEHFHSK